jgi:hypothetical protein
LSLSLLPPLPLPLPLPVLPPRPRLLLLLQLPQLSLRPLKGSLGPVPASDTAAATSKAPTTEI